MGEVYTLSKGHESSVTDVYFIKKLKLTVFSVDIDVLV